MAGLTWVVTAILASFTVIVLAGRGRIILEIIAVASVYGVGRRRS